MNLVNRLRHFIDGLTMYNVMVLALMAICINAFLLMVTGYLSYAPLNFIFSLLIFCGIGYAVNRLLGYLFGLQVHGQSAVITGLILALLFTPPSTLFIGIKLAFIAAVAMASKFIITYRNKHIFNPTATAIVVASIASIGFATWWVATPALLPITAVAVGLVLYKTQKFLMAGVYLLVSILTLTILTIVSDGISWPLIITSITSWPLLFFAGMMLTEPLTLPPKRNQQLLVAALVGVIGVTGFHYGPITMTPALALLIGNLIAWRFTAKKALRLRLVEKRLLAGDAYEFTFDTNNFHFEAGQYIEITIPHKKADKKGTRRVFSIIGHPKSEQISIATRIPSKASSAKRALQAMKTGSVVYGTRIAGDFTLPKNESTPLIFVASGIGITPFLSLLASAGNRKIILIYIASSFINAAYIKELLRFDIQVIMVTPDDLPGSRHNWTHYKSESLDKAILQRCLEQEQSADVYISGPPNTVRTAASMAKSIGAKHVITDAFTGY